MRARGVIVCTAVIVLAGWALTLTAHETKEVAGLEVVFGAEPEPAINGQPQFRWRFRAKVTKQPFGDLESLSAVVKRDGKTFGPFTGRASPREPGTVATQHIFPAARDAEAPPRHPKSVHLQNGQQPFELTEAAATGSAVAIRPTTTATNIEILFIMSFVLCSWDGWSVCDQKYGLQPAATSTP